MKQVISKKKNFCEVVFFSFFNNNHKASTQGLDLTCLESF